MLVPSPDQSQQYIVFKTVYDTCVWNYYMKAKH